MIVVAYKTAHATHFRNRANHSDTAVILVHAPARKKFREGSHKGTIAAAKMCFPAKIISLVICTEVSLALFRLRGSNHNVAGSCENNLVSGSFLLSFCV